MQRSAYFLAVFAIVTITRVASAEDADRVSTAHADTHPHVEVNAGPVGGYVSDISFWGGKVSAGVDLATRKNFTLAIAAFYAKTSTDAGLGMQWGGLSTTALWTPSRFRIGAGADILYFDLTRASHSGDPSITHPGVGVHGHLGFDLIELDGGHGIELAAIPEVDWLFGAPLTQGELVLAARF